MKKITKCFFIIIFSIICLFCIESNATSLDTVKLEVDKTNVKPGEEINLNIDFGTKLSEYVVSISYDNNIFDYVSSQGGDVTNSDGKVIIKHESTDFDIVENEKVSIIFKAKSSMNTTNPTEFTMVGRNFAKKDSTENIDDITTPLVKNIIVEPEYTNYDFSIDYDGDIVANKSKDMLITYSSSMGKSYEAARLIAEATTPEGGVVKLDGINIQDNVTQDIIKSGWGLPQGYKIGGKDIKQELKVKALFTKEGIYKIKLALIDRKNSDSVISEKEFEFKVVNESKVPTLDINNAASTNQISGLNNATGNTNLPKVLPKAGNNNYIIITSTIFSLSALLLYVNRKNKKNY